ASSGRGASHASQFEQLKRPSASPNPDLPKEHWPSIFEVDGHGANDEEWKYREKSDSGQKPASKIELHMRRSSAGGCANRLDYVTGRFPARPQGFQLLEPVPDNGVPAVAFLHDQPPGLPQQVTALRIVCERKHGRSQRPGILRRRDDPTSG